MAWDMNQKRFAFAKTIYRASQVMLLEAQKFYGETK
jgi:hypothetical protein